MPTFQPYQPEQEELLPAHVRDVLGADHLCFLLHEVVESWEVQEFVDAYSEAGGQSPYDPRLMLKVWLYAFALNVRTTRKLEQRVQEDLGFRFPGGRSGARSQDFERIPSSARGRDSALVHANARPVAEGGAGEGGHARKAQTKDSVFESTNKSERVIPVIRFPWNQGQ